jgi:hypothetical protein
VSNMETGARVKAHSAPTPDLLGGDSNNVHACPIVLGYMGKCISLGNWTLGSGGSPSLEAVGICAALKQALMGVSRMCFLLCRCTRSISVVPPVAYAHLAAKRARCLMDEVVEQDVGADGKLKVSHGPRLLHGR